MKMSGGMSPGIILCSREYQCMNLMVSQFQLPTGKAGQLYCIAQLMQGQSRKQQWSTSLTTHLVEDGVGKHCNPPEDHLQSVSEVKVPLHCGMSVRLKRPDNEFDQLR